MGVILLGFGLWVGWKCCRLFYDPEIRAGEKSWRLEEPKEDAPQQAAKARARARRQERRAEREEQLRRWSVN